MFSRSVIEHGGGVGAGVVVVIVAVVVVIVVLSAVVEFAEVVELLDDVPRRSRDCNSSDCDCCGCCCFCGCGCVGFGFVVLMEKKISYTPRSVAVTGPGGGINQSSLRTQIVWLSTKEVYCELILYVY